MIRFLLAATSLEPRLSTGECHAFSSTIGTPQGDSLSPVLFTVYLEAALRELRSRLPPRPPADAKLPLDVEYADDIDFISYSRPYLNEIERIAPVCMGEWSLQINAAKTERTSVSRQVDRTHEPWRTTRKLGSLRGEVEDVTRRMQLANVSFHKMWTVWFRGAQISLLLRLRLYSAFVLPVLTYNMGTWGLTKTELSRLDAHHRRHLRQIIGIRWPHRISNDALYRITHSSPISAAIRAARWSLFGHVLRLPLDAPVQRAIDAYLEVTGTPEFRGRPRCTLPTTLGENLRRIGRQLRNSDDIDALRTLDRSTWRDLGRSPHEVKPIHQLEMVQRRAARWTLNRHHNTSSVKGMLEDLQWRTLEQRRTDCRLVLLFQIIHGLVQIPPTSYLQPSLNTTSRKNHNYMYQQCSTRTNYF